MSDSFLTALYKDTSDRLAKASTFIFTKSPVPRKLDFQVTLCDGGQYGGEYSINNILLDDASMYCSQRPKNIGILLEHKASLRGNPIPYALKSMIIKIPLSGFSCPLKTGVIFSLNPKAYDCSEIFKDLRAFDVCEDGNTIRFSKSAPAYVKSALYFHLNRNAACFCYSFEAPVFPCTHIFIKLLTSYGGGENIDFEYFGAYGFYSGQAFSAGALQW